MPVPFPDDLAAITRIGSVPTILRVIREMTGLRVALVARVLPDRWMACAVHDDASFGLEPGAELDIHTTFCSKVRETGQMVVMDHASMDPAYAEHPTPKQYGFESYISVPLHRKSGDFFGTLCGLDPEPRTVSDPKTRNLLTLFSQLISLQLEAEERLEAKSLALDEERANSLLREQFIAVLGHDLRTPLSSVTTGTEFLAHRTTDATDLRVLERLRGSARRIAKLVDDVLDLTRGRLGGGINVAREQVEHWPAQLGHVVDELRSVHPGRKLELEIGEVGPVRCDLPRIEQLLQNLVANALEHGDVDRPVQLRLHVDAEALHVRVHNEGEPIAGEARRSLFQPFTRAPRPGKGLGLGLYIVSEIARAHGGTVAVLGEGRSIEFHARIPRH